MLHFSRISPPLGKFVVFLPVVNIAILTIEQMLWLEIELAIMKSNTFSNGTAER